MKKHSDCAACGEPVGRLGRELCCRCWKKAEEQAAKRSCPGCGKDRLLRPGTGRCAICSKTCRQCGHVVRGRDLCKECWRKAKAEAAKRVCPKCDRPGLIREATGWCGHCSRPRRGPDAPRECRECGEVRRHEGLGLCSACFQKHPQRPFIRAETIAARLGDRVPAWFDGIVAYLAARHHPAGACRLVTELGGLLADGPQSPSAVLERARKPGRSMGQLARGLEHYFTEHHLAFPTDQAEQLAAGRRQRRIDAVPEPLRPAVERFCVFMLRSRERARRAGTRPRSDLTIESALATVRDFAQFLAVECGKTDWPLVNTADVEAFLATIPKSRKRRLTVLRQFFRLARAERIMLIDPAKGLRAKTPRGFAGNTVSLEDQRKLFRRWNTPDAEVHPHERFVGLLALLHAASGLELRLLRRDQINSQNRTVLLGKRPRALQLDPASWGALEIVLEHRASLRTDNPHVLVTRITKTGREPASRAYLTHVLDAAGTNARLLRVTRLAELVAVMDPKLVAAAFGMTAENAIEYLADQIDQARLDDFSRLRTAQG